LNAGYQTSLNWDGRFASLEAQVEGVFSPYGDMGIDAGDAIGRVAADTDYQRWFRRAFAGPPTFARMAEALASYQRFLISGNTRFDRYLFGGDRSALSADEREGFDLFIGKAGCITCHDVFHPSVNGLGGGIALFTDHRFHNLGVGYENGRMLDSGRYEVTRDPTDWGAFKTPSLRNVALTAPYMHDGSLAALTDVVSFYNRGCVPNPNLAPAIRPLYLSANEEQELVLFLNSLTDLHVVQRYANDAVPLKREELKPIVSGEKGR
jgi:cytochrome c peroxidase